MAKVLLVEDDNNLREIFEMRLQAEGYQTVVAGNGEEGLVVAMKEKPDLIIADIMMPKLSGFEMLETLRASPELKDTKAIMMTALGQAEDQARGERAGVVKYLVKSQVTLEDFVRIVREVLQPDQKVAAEASAPAADLGQRSDLLTTDNKQESEKYMPDDQVPTNPMPAAPSDEPAGSNSPAPNPISDNDPAASGSTGDSGQMTNAQQQDAVQSQINDFVASTPTEPATGPAGDPSSSAPAMPTSDTPAMPPAANDPAASSGADTAPPAMGDSGSVPVSTPPPQDTTLSLTRQTPTPTPPATPPVDSTGNTI